ncbi:delta 12-fatty acid desaturase [Roridomyces roridus]|uniref:Delta 12-fatty acid desaturase n=1 Tax=Roridomyces roridus TaxID=1738132 RepID=A0AAD7CAX8_9AGAR|nr:delta 12-fatty acid desaturase [Roridomyces roridus]
MAAASFLRALCGFGCPVAEAILYAAILLWLVLRAYPVPDLSIKQLLDAIPSHCFKRSALKSSSTSCLTLPFQRLAFVDLGAIYKPPSLLTASSTPRRSLLPTLLSSTTLLRGALWTVYGFWAGLFGTGIWVIGIPINNTVGWILHSALGVPYHSWRITHAKHHASTGHMTQDQVWMGLRPIDLKREDRLGARASAEVQKELYEALGDSPIGATIGVAMYLLVGWPAYIIRNASGQQRYPEGTNHFDPKAAMFSPNHWTDVILSDIGVVFWIAGLIAACLHYGAGTVFVVYFVPYLWVNHWLVLITFLQHTDPLLPHYRAAQFTFPRGALSTLDPLLAGRPRLLHGCYWCPCHVRYLRDSRPAPRLQQDPHYNAWEAADALKKVVHAAGVRTQGAPGGWAEMYRVFRECKFVEDDGDVVFYKNAYGLAKMRPVFHGGDANASDSGIELAEKQL